MTEEKHLCNCGNPCFEQDTKCPVCISATQDISRWKCYNCEKCVADRKLIQDTNSRFKLEWCRRINDFEMYDMPAEGWKCHQCGVIICLQLLIDPPMRMMIHVQGRREHMQECDSWGTNPLPAVKNHTCNISEAILPYGYTENITQWGSVINLKGKFWHLVRMGDKQNFFATRKFHRDNPRISKEWNNMISCDGIIAYS